MVYAGFEVVQSRPRKPGETPFSGGRRKGHLKLPVLNGLQRGPRFAQICTVGLRHVDHGDREVARVNLGIAQICAVGLRQPQEDTQKLRERLRLGIALISTVGLRLELAGPLVVEHVHSELPRSVRWDCDLGIFSTSCPIAAYSELPRSVRWDCDELVSQSVVLLQTLVDLGIAQICTVGLRLSARPPSSAPRAARNCPDLYGGIATCPDGCCLSADSQWILGIALISTVGLRLLARDGGALRLGHLGIALISTGGIATPPLAIRLRGVWLARNCPNQYGGIATVCCSSARR